MVPLTLICEDGDLTADSYLIRHRHTNHPRFPLTIPEHRPFGDHRPRQVLLVQLRADRLLRRLRLRARMATPLSHRLPS